MFETREQYDLAHEAYNEYMIMLIEEHKSKLTEDNIVPLPLDMEKFCHNICIKLNIDKHDSWITFPDMLFKDIHYGGRMDEPLYGRGFKELQSKYYKEGIYLIDEISFVIRFNIFITKKYTPEYIEDWPLGFVLDDPEHKQIYEEKIRKKELLDNDVVLKSNGKFIMTIKNPDSDTERQYFVNDEHIISYTSDNIVLSLNDKLRFTVEKVKNEVLTNDIGKY